MNLQNSSWKTSVAGIVSGIAIVLIPVLQTGEVTLQRISIAVAIAVLGLFSKDHDKSGDPQKPMVHE